MLLELCDSAPLLSKRGLPGWRSRCAVFGVMALALTGCSLLGGGVTPPQPEPGPDGIAACVEEGAYWLREGQRGTDPALPPSADGVHAQLEMYSYDATDMLPFVNLSWTVDPRPSDGPGTGEAEKYIVGETIDIPSYGSLKVVSVCEDGVSIDVLE